MVKGCERTHGCVRMTVRCVCVCCGWSSPSRLLSASRFVSFVVHSPSVLCLSLSHHAQEQEDHQKYVLVLLRRPPILCLIQTTYYFHCIQSSFFHPSLCSQSPIFPPLISTISFVVGREEEEQGRAQAETL